MWWGGRSGRAPRGPLLPGRWRVPAAMLALACAGITALLGWIYAGQTRAGPLDSAAGSWLTAALGGHGAALGVVARLGSAPWVVAMTGALALGCAVARRWNGAVMAGLGVGAAGGLTEWVLKPVVGRTLQGDLCYPSGHTTGAFAVATACVVLLAAPPGRRVPPAARAVLALAALAGAAAVAVSVVALGEHYLTDAAGGAALSVAVVLAVTLGIDLLPGRLRGRKADGRARDGRRGPRLAAGQGR